MYSRILSSGLYGLTGELTWVEVDIEMGLPCFNAVGLVNQSVREAKERVHSAIINSKFKFPQNKITVNLTPANRKKYGSHYDLPIAIGVLMASKQLEYCDGYWDKTAILGELTLNGKINAVDGLLPMLIGLQKSGVERVIIPAANLKEASLVKDILLYPVNNLKEVVDHLNGFSPINPVSEKGYSDYDNNQNVPDFSDIRGQNTVKRASVVAAAGMHGLLMVGPPGVGKSMIGKRIPGIMPPLTYEEQLSITQIYSVAGLLSEQNPMIVTRPFRAPHHGISATALVGGGASPKPGEISLSHCGVLFLDELPEFSPQTLDNLRQPMEDGYVSITRVNGKYVYPASFMLVAAMNPCRCGYYGDPIKECTCKESERMHYLGKVSGPLLDRIDMYAAMDRIQYDEISDLSKENTVSSSELRRQVISAVEIQRDRFSKLSINFNSQLTPDLIKKYCNTDNCAEKLLENAFKQWNLSARQFHRILKVARTIADLSDSEIIKEEHVLEALSYRMPDRLQK